MESLCNAKKANRPRAFMSSQDGGAIHANMIRVALPANADIPAPDPLCFFSEDSSLPPPPVGTIRERFMADTGANRSIHPNARAAATFYRLNLDISTASVGNSMRSEGVGKNATLHSTRESFSWF